MNLTYRLVRPGMLGLKPKNIRDAGREAIRDAGVYWHQHYKPFHFQLFAFAKYGYAHRTAAYERRKQREHPEANGRPLVWSGDSEKSAMASTRVDATAKSWESYTATCVVNAPKLNFQCAGELVRVTVSEERKLAEVFRDSFDRRLIAAAVANTQFSMVA